MSTASTARTTVTSPCLPDTLAALGAGRIVLLDGAIDDDVLLFSTRAPLTHALAESWRSHSGAVAVAWKPGSGLEPVFAEELPRLDAAARTATRDERDLNAVLDSDPLAAADPLEVAALLGRLLSQHETRLLIVVEHADLLVGAGADLSSRRVVAAMLSAIEALERSAPLHGLVLLGHDIARVAPTIVRRAGVARLRIPAKSTEERTLAAAEAFERAAGDQAIRRLAAAADGLALREIAMLPAHGEASGLGLERPRELVSSFRHGHRVDPWAALTPALMEDVRTQVQAHVHGQLRAVREVLDRLDVARSGLDLDPPNDGTRKSRLELFLVGPTGVGKNELARALARAIFGDPSAVLTFDMSAFQQEHSGEQLFGAPPGYVGHENGSPLVDRLRERPFTVIVFDEIEKAHPNNWLRLMAAIDEGRVTDTRQVQASLEHAIVIFTSNIGGDVLLDRALQGPVDVDEVEQITLGLVEAHLSQATYELRSGERRRGLGKPEVWGRLSGSVVPFDLLRDDALDRIVERFCTSLASSAEGVWDMELTLDVASITSAVRRRLGAPGTWNGRLVKGHVDRLVRRPLARALAREGATTDARVTAGLDDGDALWIR